MLLHLSVRSFTVAEREREAMGRQVNDEKKKSIERRTSATALVRRFGRRRRRRRAPAAIKTPMFRLLQATVLLHQPKSETALLLLFVSAFFLPRYKLINTSSAQCDTSIKSGNRLDFFLLAHKREMRKFNRLAPRRRCGT